MAIEEHSESAAPEYVISTEDGQPVSQAVIKAVAELSDRAAIPNDSTRKGDAGTPLRPLYEAIDPDALNTICESSAAEAELRVTFTYCGYEVTVKSGSEITVFER